MRKLLALALCLLASSAQAAISYDDLRALVLARDFAGTNAALKQAQTEYTAAHTPDKERDLYYVFALSDPAVGQFVLDWTKAAPENPRALTAKAWNLFAWGWTMRGNGNSGGTMPEAMQAMVTRHTAAFDLFEKASKIAPDLIPASDGMLRLTQTLNNISVIPIELERIMSTQPNRGSLMRAMISLAPQWGGRPEQVNLLCDRYAPKITDVKDYTPEVCRIDAVYYANFWYGNQRAAAHQLLMFTPNPILDYARLDDLVAGFMSPEETVAGLKKHKAEASLSIEEARMLDAMQNNLARVETMDAKYPEYSEALLRVIPELKEAIGKDPLNPQLLHHYISVLNDAQEFAGRPLSTTETADVLDRLKTTLEIVPTASPLWVDLAHMTLQMDDLDSISKAEPYFHNAIYYSGYGVFAFSEAVRPKVRLVLDQTNLLHAVDISKLSAEQLAKLDAIVNCPLAAQLNMITLACQNTGTPDNQCAEGATTNEVILGRLKERITAGACATFFAEGLPSLYATPVKVDF